MFFSISKMGKKKTNLSLHRRKRKTVIEPFKRAQYKQNETVQEKNCSPFKSPLRKHRRVIASPVKAPSWASSYVAFVTKSPFKAIRYSPNTSLSSKIITPRKYNGKSPPSKHQNNRVSKLRGVEQKKTSVKSLFSKPDSRICTTDENDDLWEEIENVDCDTESDTELDSINHTATNVPTINDISNDEGSIENEMADMLPSVLNEFSKHGLETDLLSFFQLVSENRFPFSNIAFLLWLEIVRWYRQGTSTTMRYMDQTKMFWKLGWRLFGGKFIRYMGGFKNEGNVVQGDAEKGNYNPQISDLNFAIPSLEILRDFCPYGDDNSQPRKPGVYNDIMEKAAEVLQGTSACLTFDGKKIKQGLTADSGDVDLLGFEEGLSLKDRQNDLAETLKTFQTFLAELSNHDQETNVRGLEEPAMLNILQTLKYAHTKISQLAQDIRELKAKKEFAKSKFIERGGEDWRNGKFIYVISALHAHLYDIDSFLNMYMGILDDLIRCIADINGATSEFAPCEEVNLNDKDNYIPLPQENDSQNPRFVKQRSEEWHKIRREALITGSTIYKALGLDTLKAQREHFDNVVCGIPEKQPSEEQMKNMKYGTENEINAVATVVGRILPVMHPNMKCFEEGCLPVEFNDKPFLVVSPDGSIGYTGDANYRQIYCGLEIKCPVRQLHNEVPVRYYLQCLCEMAVLDVRSLMYVCWTPKITRTFVIDYNEEILLSALKIATDIYGTANPKKPSKLHPEANVLKERIKTECSKAKLIGEFPSCKVSTNDPPMNQALESKANKVKDVRKIVGDVSYLVKEAFEINRQKASEVSVVFLITDLNRNWSKNPLRWAPICWFLKGYSLTTETMRKIAEHVHTECYKAGLHIPCQAFDGQWHTMVNRSVAGKPLTVYQLQKDVWHETEKMQKSEIIKELSTLNRTPLWEKDDTVPVIIAYSENNRLPKLSPKGWRQNKKEDKRKPEDTDDVRAAPLLADSIPEEIISAIDDETEECQAHHDHSESVIYHVTADTDSVEAIALCNVDPVHWVGELVDIQEAASVEVEDVTNDVNVSSLFELHESQSDDWVRCSSEVLETSTNICLSNDDAHMILLLLRTNKSTNIKGQWDNKSEDDVMKACLHFEDLSKLRDVDLKVLIQYLNKKFACKLRESDSKKKKLTKLSEVLSLDAVASNESMSRTRKRKIKSLRDLSLSVLTNKVPKNVLNITYSEFIWPERLKCWKSSSPLLDEIKIKETNEPEYWFYIPEYSESRSQLEVRCIDSTHLLTRTRRKCCKGGLDGIDNKAWVKVASQRKTFLSLSMVKEIVDPMSTKMAVTTFSEAVETEMRKNGDLAAANLCRDIRLWWNAEDLPGITAKDRIKMRMPLRKRLLSDNKFEEFPPRGMYVNGWPSQLWEALLASIDSKAILYSLCRNKTYNSRAFSTMMNETFFSELTNQDRRGHGTVSATEFATHIGAVVEQMHMRLDSDRYVS